MDNESSSLWNLALDRIKSIEISDIKFIPNEEYDFSEYFENIVGVTKFEDEPEQKVVLEFTNHRLPYVISKPIHGSQKVNGNLISLELKQNNELISLLLSFGSDLRVLEPESLRLKLQEEIEKMKNNYL